MALWREAPLEEVLRVVCEGLQWLGGGQAGAVQASKVGDLAGVHPAGPWTAAAWTWLTSLPTAAFFGYPGAWRGQSAFPQARVLGLVGCGTHAVVAAGIAPYS